MYLSTSVRDVERYWLDMVGLTSRHGQVNSPLKELGETKESENNLSVSHTNPNPNCVHSNFRTRITVNAAVVQC